MNYQIPAGHDLRRDLFAVDQTVFVVRDGNHLLAGHGDERDPTVVVDSNKTTSIEKTKTFEVIIFDQRVTTITFNLTPSNFLTNYLIYFCIHCDVVNLKF
jgi:hypothetical protein